MRWLAVPLSLGLAVSAVPAGAEFPAELADNPEFNLDCIAAISAQAIAAQAGEGIATDMARVGPLIVYYMGRYEGMTGENPGEALNLHAQEEIDVKALYPICVQAMDKLEQAFAAAEPGMDAMEARIRDEIEQE